MYVSLLEHPLNIPHNTSCSSGDKDRILGLRRALQVMALAYHLMRSQHGFPIIGRIDDSGDTMPEQTAGDSSLTISPLGPGISV